MLDMDLETVCWLIVKMREFEVEDALPVNARDDDENLSPDQLSEQEEILDKYLERVREDPLYEDAKRVIDELNEDAQVELVALVWMGRGDYSGPQEWPEAVREARGRRNAYTADYLLGNPLVADYLEEGLSQLGLSCEGTDAWSV
ncbi:DUF3775 domain-containing protein [Ferruginivarius sediminum]|uniref:DUF3775 domain-containing protein n=1 Tax=Ferruginivarius sediminum TaxID=2661937 RepID=A0A369TC80_9PROT|nr:DUF3775 domain-containing protein [Ferruginivarius sediminum]RDD60516.1 DUF3775 domain-containing protein [Ferruginivarius sediminum]